MMKLRSKTVSMMALLLCTSVVSVSMALASPPKGGSLLGGLNRAISRAGATALTSDQVTQLNTLIANYEAALPDEDDATLEAAREAYNAAILAGNLSAATAQATIIANRTAALTSARLQARAQFQIGVLAVLRSGGQLDALIATFGEDRVLGLIGGAGHEHR